MIPDVELAVDDVEEELPPDEASDNSLVCPGKYELRDLYFCPRGKQGKCREDYVRQVKSGDVRLSPYSHLRGEAVWMQYTTRKEEGNKDGYLY